MKSIVEITIKSTQAVASTGYIYQSIHYTEGDNKYLQPQPDLAMELGVSEQRINRDRYVKADVALCGEYTGVTLTKHTSE